MALIEARAKSAGILRYNVRQSAKWRVTLAEAVLQCSTSGLGQLSGWQIPEMTFAVAIESLRNVVKHDDGGRQRALRLTCSQRGGAWRLQRQQSRRCTLVVGAMKGLRKVDQAVGTDGRSWRGNRNDGGECVVEEGTSSGIRAEAGSRGTFRPLATNASVSQGALPTGEGGKEGGCSWAAKRSGRDCRERARRDADD